MGVADAVRVGRGVRVGGARVAATVLEAERVWVGAEVVVRLGATVAVWLGVAGASVGVAVSLQAARSQRLARRQKERRLSNTATRFKEIAIVEGRSA